MTTRPLLALLLLAGCATGPTMEYARLDGSPVDPAQRSRDLDECNYEAELATVDRAGDPFGRAAVMGSIADSCMELRGYDWRPVAAQ